MRLPFRRRPKPEPLRAQGIGSVECPRCHKWLVARYPKIACPHCGHEFDPRGNRVTLP